MNYTKRLLLLGLGVFAAYSAIAIITCVTYERTAYAPYEAEKARLYREYIKLVDEIPRNNELRLNLESRLNSEWERTLAEIENRRETALEPIRSEYWTRMERAKKKRDSSDTLSQLEGSTDELRADTAWRTDSGPIAAQFARERAAARAWFEKERDSALAEFDRNHFSDSRYPTLATPSHSLLPTMSLSELRTILIQLGVGLLAATVALVCFTALKGWRSEHSGPDRGRH